ncbi:MAG: response regulator transcription factor, partial [Pseudomonadota bacterium]
MLTAWRHGSASNAGSPSLCTAPDIVWLTPHITAPNQLLPALRRQRPDVLLLGQDIYDELGAEPLSQLRTQFAGLHILLVAQAPTPELYDEVLRCRFRGVLPANCPPEACPSAVRAICQGEIWLPRASLSKLAARAMDTRVFGQTLPLQAPARAAKSPKLLSRREKEIVELVRHGLTNKEIARRLGIREDTVKKHLQNVFGKLG